VLGALLVALLLAVTVGGAELGAVLVARHRAQSAADLAALAAAARLPAGPDRACARARDLAHRMGLTEIDCVVEKLDVVVTVSVALPAGAVGLRAPVRAAARAGPVTGWPR